MQFFKVKPEFDNKSRPDGSILIANELYTEREVKRFGIPACRLDSIEVSPRDTYFCFGARFLSEV